MGEQRKPIHERNWSSDAFDRLATSITGKEIDYSDRIPAYVVNTYVNPSIKY